MKKYLPFILVVLHVVGLFGLKSEARDWFLSLTPLNLLITFLVSLLLIQKGSVKSILPTLVIAFAGGFFAEYIGVHTGLLFGDYAYGEGLGPSWKGIPWAIGMNWAMLVLITRSILNRVVSSSIVQPILAATLMVGLDLLIEPVAPHLDYWAFDGGIAPFTNYLGWFLVALILHFVGNLFKAKTWDTRGDVLILTVQASFFAVLILSN